MRQIPCNRCLVVVPSLAAVIFAVSAFAADAPKKSLPEIPLNLTLIELTYSPPKPAEDPADSASGTVSKTIEVIEKVSPPAAPKPPKPSVDSVKTTITTDAPIIPTKAKTKKTGTSTGQLKYEGKFQFTKDNSFDIWVAPSLVDGIRIQLGDPQKPLNSVVTVTNKTNDKRLVKMSVKPLDPPTDCTITILVPLAKDAIVIKPGATTLSGADTQISEVTVLNRSADDWPAGGTMTIKNGSDVIYEGNRPLIPAGATIALTQRKTLPTTLPAELRQIILTYSAPTSAATPSSPASTPPSPPAAAAGKLAVGTQETRTETIEEPKGNVQSVKTTFTAVAATDAPKSPSSSKTGTTSGLLIYHGKFDPSNAFSVKIDPDATKDEDVSIELIDANGSPIGWKMDSDRIADSKVTKSNPQRKIVTLTVKPQGSIGGTLVVRVPLAGNKATADIGYVARMEEESRLINQITVKNQTSVNWADCRLTVKTTGDQVIYDRVGFAPLPADGTRVVSQKLAALVDAKTIFVDLSGLVDGVEKAKPDNVARLPRSMKIDNGKPCPDGERLPLVAGINIQLRWNAAHVPLVKLPDSTSLKTALPLGINCPAGEKCEHCCGPTGVCAVDGPKEKSPFVTFLPIGEDPRVGVIAASRSKPSPFIPLSIANGELTYVSAERWKFKVCLKDDCDASNVRFIDSRTGVTGFGSPPQFQPQPQSPKEFFAQYEPRSVYVTAQKLTALDGPDDLADLIDALRPNFEEVFNSLTSGVPASYNEELAPLFCLAAASKKSINSVTSNPLTTRSYMQCLSDQLQVPFGIAKNYRVQKSELDKNQEIQKVLLTELQQLIAPRNGDQFGLAALKIRLEVERLQINENKLKMQIQHLGSELIDAVATAKSCN